MALWRDGGFADDIWTTLDDAAPTPERGALGEPARGRHDDRAGSGNRFAVGEAGPDVVDEAALAPQRHQMSIPAVSAPRWIPHSVLARPRQRPARASSPGLTGLVHGRQPIEG